MTNLVQHLDDNERPVDALFVYGANPVVSNPDTNGVRRALGRDDLFTVVVDLFFTDTTDYADIVLPSTMQHEQLELNNSFAHYYLNLNQPAVSPPGECLSHSEIFRRLAVAMGLDEPTLQASDDELLDALLDTATLRSAGVTSESLRETGFVRLPETPSPYLAFEERFPTASGRFEFVSERGERDGVGRLPHYVAAAEAAREPKQAGDYDLVAAAGDWHINSTFAGTKVTESRTGPPAVTIHPADAARDGLSEGQLIEISNDRGGFTAALTLSDLARPGTAVSTKGSWKLDINTTTSERNSDMAQGATFHDNRVRIRAI